MCPLFVLLPLGTFFIRSSSPHSLHLHLIPQILGSILGLAGISLGFFLSTTVSVRHQYIGLAIRAALVAQLGLRLQHHRVFSRPKRRTWTGMAHIWIGRSVPLGGWANLIAGLELSGHSINLKVEFLIATVIGMLSVRKNLKLPSIKVTKGVEWADGGIASLESYFALDDGNDDGKSSDADTIGDGRAAKSDGKEEMH